MNRISPETWIWGIANGGYQWNKRLRRSILSITVNCLGGTLPLKISLTSYRIRYSPKIRACNFSAVWTWPWWTDRCRLLGSLSLRAPQLDACQQGAGAGPHPVVLGCGLPGWGLKLTVKLLNAFPPNQALQGVHVWAGDWSECICLGPIMWIQTHKPGEGQCVIKTTVSVHLLWRQFSWTCLSWNRVLLGKPQ